MSKSAFYGSKDAIRKHRDFLVQEVEEIRIAAYQVLATVDEADVWNNLAPDTRKHMLKLDSTLNQWTEKRKTFFSSSTTSSDSDLQE